MWKRGKTQGISGIFPVEKQRRSDKKERITGEKIDPSQAFPSFPPFHFSCGGLKKIGRSISPFYPIPIFAYFLQKCKKKVREKKACHGAPFRVFCFPHDPPGRFPGLWKRKSEADKALYAWTAKVIPDIIHRKGHFIPKRKARRAFLPCASESMVFIIGKDQFCLVPHSGQNFALLWIFAPHSEQNLVSPVGAAADCCAA